MGSLQEVRSGLAERQMGENPQREYLCRFNYTALDSLPRLL